MDSTPASHAPAPATDLVAVDRAVADLRRGAFVLVIAPEGSRLVQAAEAATPETLRRLSALAGTAPGVALTGRRAAVLNLVDPLPAVAVLSAAAPFDAETLRVLVDPSAASPAGLPPDVRATPAESHEAAGAAVRLTKLGRLLPAAVMAPLENTSAADLAEAHDILAVSAEQVTAYPAAESRTLHAVTEARVPLLDAEDASVVAFRPGDGGVEHLAIRIGSPDPDGPVLVRLHSECFTGDLLGSLRCDCGDQLRGAISEIAQAGGGVLLYLAQEGRGIGLINKLRAYQVQDQGFDTVDANEQLGFDDDERVYLPAAEMLARLGIDRVRLLTNNPAKVESLGRHNVTVVERVPHAFPSNGHNEAYLRAKAERTGHFL